MSQVAFFALAALMAVSAIRLVTSKNVVHGALYLLSVLGGAAVLFLMLAAEFVGWVQVLIYVGAIVILLLFGLMLTRAPIGMTAMDNHMRVPAAFVAGSLFLLTSGVTWKAFAGKQVGFQPVLSTGAVGRELFTRFVLPFEVVSVLLLAALIGAVMLARKED